MSDQLDPGGVGDPPAGEAAGPLASAVSLQGWIGVVVPTRHEERAKRTRAERDRQYGNIYTEQRTDERWVGDLGEMVFDSWLKHEGVEGYEWIVDEAVGRPNFVTRSEIRIGVKSVKRMVAPLLTYTAQVTARHAAEPVDQFSFMTYEIAKRRMWLLGGIERERLLAEARYCAARGVGARAL